LDSLNGVTGPFSRRIFHEILGAPLDACAHSVPLDDFGGLHPDPNLTYAADLVARVNSDAEHIDFGCAWDGDGDRNMILGHKFFVTPSDSLAVIAHYATTAIPHYKAGLKALSRSMPTSAAVDRVAKALKLPLYEVPTGWKFFGNLMDKYETEGSEGFICGEESFGTGSAHIREKDGIWATLAWLNILAFKNKNVAVGSPLVSVGDIVREHWKIYGRNYYCRYDYEAVDTAAANNMMANLNDLIKSAKAGVKMGAFELAKADDFEYLDPVDKSVSSKQGIRFVFSDGSRFVVRLSGTGSVGATIRLYLEQYEPNKIDLNALDALKPLIRVALDAMNLNKFIGTETPTVIT
jgi:phosphoglucomutase